MAKTAVAYICIGQYQVTDVHVVNERRQVEGREGRDSFVTHLCTELI